MLSDESFVRFFKIVIFKLFVMFVREKEKMKNQYYWLWISVGVGLLSIFSFYPLVILKIFSLFICMLLGKVAPLKTFCFRDSLFSQKLWPRLLHEFHGKLLKGMITWAIRENIRNPMPDYSSSPLETLNNIWDINPNDKGSNDNQSAWPSNVDRESSNCLKWSMEPSFRARRSEIIQSWILSSIRDGRDWQSSSFAFWSYWKNIRSNMV